VLAVVTHQQGAARRWNGSWHSGAGEGAGAHCYHRKVALRPVPGLPGEGEGL
jgi:hypothetical protein